MSNTHPTTAPGTSPAEPVKTLVRLVPMAYNVAALGGMVKDIAFESFNEEEKADYFDRLCALGECIDIVAKQIAECADDTICQSRTSN